MVFGDRRIGNEILSLRTTKAVMFFLVNQLALQVLAVPHSATPQRNEGGRLVALERANNIGRAVSAIRDRLTDRDLVVLSNTLDLLEIRLIVVPCSGRHLRIQDDPTVGINRLMYFVLQLPWCSLLLS